MASFLEQLGLSVVLALLSKLKKTPADVPGFKTVLEHIVTDACEVLGVAPPTMP